MVDLCKAYKDNKDKQEKNPRHYFDLKFRSKNDVQ
ncbi:unnamed protein product, partial [Sphacelaria rigidula]